MIRFFIEWFFGDVRQCFILLTHTLCFNSSPCKGFLCFFKLQLPSPNLAIPKSFLSLNNISKRCNNILLTFSYPILWILVVIFAVSVYRNFRRDNPTALSYQTRKIFYSHPHLCLLKTINILHQFYISLTFSGLRVDKLKLWLILYRIWQRTIN